MLGNIRGGHAKFGIACNFEFAACQPAKNSKGHALSGSATQSVPPGSAGSLARRYGYKLMATLAAALTGVGVDSFASRALGPTDYGNFYYLQQFFFYIFAFLSGSVSLGFVTRAARRPASKSFALAYASCLLLAPLVMEVFILAAFRLGYGEGIWTGLGAALVQLGSLSAFLMFLAREGTSVGDAYGLTVRLETIRTVQRVVAFLLILSLYLANRLDLWTFFVYTCAVNGALAAWLFLAIRRQGAFRFPRRLRRTRLAVAGTYLFRYSAPLLTFSLVVTLVGLFDRWLLQNVAGGADQGYYSLAYQISQMMLLLIGAFIPLLMREMSIAHGSGDRGRLARIFSQVIKNLYFVAAFGACFVAVFCDKVSILIGGQLFAASAFPLALVVLATMHRTYGQVTSTLYYATGQTRFYRNVAVAVTLIGMALSVVLIGPRRWFGLEMGAEGLAIKTFLLEIVNANLIAYFSCRYLNLPFRQFVLHQVGCAGFFLGIAAVLRVATNGIVQGSTDVVFLAAWMGGCGLLYAFCALALIYFLPQICGLDRQQLNRLIDKRPWRARAR
jgi:O-antigen/teichoic acid export membrane protein